MPVSDEAQLRSSDLDFRTVFPAMGTVVEVLGVGEAYDNLADTLASHALVREQLWSKFDPASDISRLNRAAGSGRWIAVHEDTATFLTECINYVSGSNGIFSLTIGALSRLWNVRAWLADLAAGRSPRLPSIAEVEQARATARADALALNDAGEFRLIEGAVLDLGGVAKGRLADELRDIALRSGLHSVLVSVGSSSIATWGERSARVPWRTGIRSLESNPLSILGSIDLDGESLATSGDYLQRLPHLIDGMVIHHVIDPRTGFPAQSQIRQATVVTANGARAEVAATTLLVTGELPLEIADECQWLVVRDKGYQMSEHLAWNRPGVRE